MRDAAFAICLLHGVYWGAFIAVRAFSAGRERRSTGSPAAQGSQTARFSTLVLVVHAITFWAMYSAIYSYSVQPQAPEGSSMALCMGTLIILAAATLACWTLLTFRSWRLRAKIEPGHELATSGPFKLMWHPDICQLRPASTRHRIVDPLTRALDDLCVHGDRR